jgi:hypothetical protein
MSPEPTNRRVVVTGIGVVSSVGVGRLAFWESLLAGRSGVGPVESFDTSGYSVHNGGEVKAFDPEVYFNKTAVGNVGRASQMAVAAAKLALDDAGVSLGALDSRRCGVAVGTTSGEPREVERYDDLEARDELDKLGSEFIGRYPCHLIAANVARELDFRGVNILIPAACAAGNYAMGYAFDALRWNRADFMLAGGADAFSRITFTGFASLGAIAPEICQPFDRERKGMIPGEGAAVLVLEPGGGLRPVLRCPPHDRLSSVGGRPRPSHGASPAAHWLEARAGELHQRPRHRNPHQRQAGDRGSEAGPGSRGLRGAHELCEVHAGTHYGSRFRHGGSRLLAGGGGGSDSADDQLP